MKAAILAEELGESSADPRGFEACGAQLLIDCVVTRSEHRVRCCCT